MKKKIILALACRNNGSRLYGKPLQILDAKKKISVLTFIIKRIKKLKIVDDIVLAISNKKGNCIFEYIAKKEKIKFIYGDDKDVLKRLINCGKLTSAKNILRITSESPYTYLNKFPEEFKIHEKGNYDMSCLDNVIDGCNYEIIKLDALVKSHKEGSKQDKSEFCSRYIRNNKKKFKIRYIKPLKFLIRKDLRLTVDNPEDLIICRKAYKYIDNYNINFKNIVKLISLKKNKELISKYLETGYSNLYL
jgi:spore coat polysaccharide biosynthesis protein SpsF